MPSSLKSFEEFDQLLATARAELDTMFMAVPDDGAIISVKRQLAALHGWTRGGRCPSQAEKDQLNFGQIASRALDTYPVADTLYELASFVIAAALVRPSKSVMDLEASSVVKRMKDKAFARAVSREDLRKGAEELGLPLDEHIGNVIRFLRERAEALGVKGAAN